MKSKIFIILLLVAFIISYVNPKVDRLLLLYETQNNVDMILLNMQIKTMRELNRIHAVQVEFSNDFYYVDKRGKKKPKNK